MKAFIYYPYRFVQKFQEANKQNSFLRHKLLYTFKSPKTHQCYWVWVEAYEHDMYAVKFHLKAHRNSKDKYNLMTGLNEARPVINTCIAIMREIAKDHPHASFGFIGASMRGEPEFMTKRFRVYSRIMATYFTEDVFEHYVNVSKSAYMLIRKSELESSPGLVEELSVKFIQLYDYFD